MIKVPCLICKEDIPLLSLKEHIISTCIPWFLFQYGLEEFIPCLDLSLLDLKKKNIKLMQKIQELSSFNNKTESTVFNPTIKHDKFTELTDNDMSEPSPNNDEINPNNNNNNYSNNNSSKINDINPTLNTTTINNNTTTNNNNNSINNIRDFESLYTLVEEDSADHNECHLTSSFKSTQTGDLYRLCTNSAKQTTRVELFVGNLSLIICKSSHLGNTIALNIIKSSFGIKTSDDLTKAPLKESDWNGECSRCGVRCTFKFRAKPSGLPDLQHNFKLFCCFSHMVSYFLNLKVNNWKKIYEKGKREQRGIIEEVEDDEDNEEKEKEDEDEEEDTSDVVNHRPLKKSKTCSTESSKPLPKPKETIGKKRGKVAASKRNK